MTRARSPVALVGTVATLTIVASLAAAGLGVVVATSLHWSAGGWAAFCCGALPLVAWLVVGLVLARRWRVLMTMVTQVDTTSRILGDIGGLAGIDDMLGLLGLSPLEEGLAVDAERDAEAD